jgi:transposase
MQGRKQYTEKLFTHFQLSEWVPTNNFYRRLKEQLDLHFLYAATAKYYGSEGNESIDPVVFFKLILVGYLENLCSDRRIIDSVCMRMDQLFFIGYDLGEPLPWHSTLSRTRQLYGEEVFRQLFKEVLKQCIDKGMVAGKRQAVDSVFIKANASMDSLMEKDILEDADHYSEELKSEEEQLVMKVYKNQQPKHQEHLSNKTHYSATDPDARLSVKPGKMRQLNYLGQLSVDTSHHVITNIEAHHADKRDSQCLDDVLVHTIENLQPHGLIIEEIIADTNYSSADALQACEQKNITAYIPNLGQYKPERNGFIYDEVKDQFVCNQGAVLPMKKLRKTARELWVKVYRSSTGDCKQCPLRSTCIGGKSEFKTIEQTTNKPLYDKMHHRMQTAYAKQLRRIRSSTVEPVIGTLINFVGVRRVNTKGIHQANKCLLIAAIAYNLKKLMKFKPRRALSVQSPLPKINTVVIKQTKKLANSFHQLIERIIANESFNVIWNFIRRSEVSYTNSLLKY